MAFGNATAVWNVGRGAFGNANAVQNVGRGTFGNTILNCKFDFFAGKRTVGAVSRPYKSICKGGLGTAPTNA